MDLLLKEGVNFKNDINFSFRIYSSKRMKQSQYKIVTNDNCRKEK